MSRESPGKESSEEAAWARLRQSPGRYIVSSSRSKESLLRAATFHEAGHAVAAVSLGLTVRFAILHDTTSSGYRNIGGYCEFAFDPGGAATEEQALAAYNTPEILRVRGIQGLAGAAAEWSAAEDQEAAADVKRSAEDDERRVYALAIQAAGRDAALSLYQSWGAEADRLIRQHWPRCCAVADYLLGHPNEQMHGMLIEEIVRRQH